MSEADRISLEVLTVVFKEWKNGHGKNLIIVNSVFAIISMMSSALLIWVIFQSKDRLTTTYHRLLLGMSISDSIYSLSLGLFDAMSPAEMSYMLWNASGSQASCHTSGFLTIAGAFSGMLYTCSLNLYFLVKVKYNQTDNYIHTRIEPFLHGVPIAIALILSTILLVRQNYNSSGGDACYAPVFDPPHCKGYEDGQVREGFEIPCGRGRDGSTTAYLAFLIVIFVVPITLVVSLGSIYRFVSKQEKKNARYGGSSNSNSQQTSNDKATDDDNSRNDAVTGFGSLMSWLLSLIKRGSKTAPSNSNTQDNTYSRAVAQKALAYSLTYPLTWGWPIGAAIMGIIGVWTSNPIDLPNWQLVYRYMWVIFNPLQGLFTFLIFMHPNVMKAKRSGSNISLCQAFFVALRSSVTGGR